MYTATPPCRCGTTLGAFSGALDNGAAPTTTPERVEVVVDGDAGQEMLGWLLSLVLGAALVGRGR